jgi:hypothetical protein
MQNLSGEAALIGAHDDNDQVTYGALARVGEKFVVVEQKADAVANLAHTFGVFKINETDGEHGERFKLSPERCAFLLTERPQGWHVDVRQHPDGWWYDVMDAVHHSLEPHAPKPN